MQNLHFSSSNWEKIKNNAISSTAPVLIHEEGDVIKRALRDIYDNDTKYIHVEGNEGYQKTKNYLKLMMPNQIKKVKKYRDKIPLFYKENIEKKLFEICRIRDLPILTFCNKMDRESRDNFEIIDEIQETLTIDVTPMSWPIGSGNNFICLLYTSPSPRDATLSRMPSSA